MRQLLRKDNEPLLWCVQGLGLLPLPNMRRLLRGPDYPISGPQNSGPWPAGMDAVPPEGLESEDMERLVVRLFRSELASISRQSRDVTREYDEVSANGCK